MDEPVYDGKPRWDEGECEFTGGGNVPTVVVGMYARFGVIETRHELDVMGLSSGPVARRGPGNGRIHRDKRSGDVRATRGHFIW